jgi:hypothetical protein
MTPRESITKINMERENDHSYPALIRLQDLANFELQIARMSA